MFSGKSSELIRRVRRFQHARRSCMIVRYERDNRYSSTSVSSHDKQQIQAVSAVLLADLRDTIATTNPDVIAVDEGQFFPDIVEFCEAMANAGKVVIVSALDGDFRRKPFGRILELLPMAEKLDKLTAVCVKCCGDAAFTERTVASTQIELIGAGDIYQPVCRKCFEDGSLISGVASPTALLRSTAAAAVSSRSAAVCSQEDVEKAAAGEAGSARSTSPFAPADSEASEELPSIRSVSRASACSSPGPAGPTAGSDMLLGTLKLDGCFLDGVATPAAQVPIASGGDDASGKLGETAGRLSLSPDDPRSPASESKRRPARSGSGYGGVVGGGISLSLAIE